MTRNYTLSISTITTDLLASKSSFKPSFFCVFVKFSLLSNSKS